MVTRAIERVLRSADLERVIPELPAELLHRVIETRGLSACGELVAHATSAQIMRILDLDVWRAGPRTGDAFDAARFGAWIAVLIEAGPDIAVEKLAGLDRDLVIAGFAQHLGVFDQGVVAQHLTTDGDWRGGMSFGDRLTAEVGGFAVVAKREDAWEAIVTVLEAAADRDAAFFAETMAGCRAYSDSDPERDGLDDLLGDDDQLLLDVGVDRDRRQESHGYVSAGDARAFLELSRRAQTGAQAVDAASGLIAQSYARQAPPNSHALLQAVASEALPDTRLLLAAAGDQPPSLGRMDTRMQRLGENDPRTYAVRIQELGFLANTIKAGTSNAGRAFSAREAWDAAVATCNLGLDTLGAPESYLFDHDLIVVFQVGWTVLHDEVAMASALRLIEVLADLRCHDRLTQAGLISLRRELIAGVRAGQPWQAREAMDALASVDVLAWTTLLTLIAEYPVMHAAIAKPSVHRVGATDIEFIAERRQVEIIQKYLDALPRLLR